MHKVKAIFALVAAILFAMSPVYSSGFNGFSAGQFPIPQDTPPVQPAGYAFSIWGLIYIWLLAGALFGLINRYDDPAWDAMRWPYIVSLVLGSAWIPVANISPAWATALIWLMWGTAALALMRAGTRDRIWLRTPIALYTGWLTAASCVALGLLLPGYGVLSQSTAALLMIALALALSAAMLALRPDTPEFAAAVVWALVGIAVTNADPVNWPVLALSGAGVVALALLVLRGRPDRLS
ncbi:hypothetical protein FIU85_03490 [Roseovarius sp. THAF8]|uniref:TspO/MBR family protein n=1 Tax=Roseovarius sp. THAF8 TaxID=2587846 RepID=UPI001268A571|nr:TspO/MBR family protein [Roseovarius sp. THAF8]QFT96356.1 hypothetical protein FIU85_03490 [Roseovarius sp. THAF8]